jgi:hypothetical protein
LLVGVRALSTAAAAAPTSLNQAQIFSSGVVLHPYEPQLLKAGEIGGGSTSFLSALTSAEGRQVTPPSPLFANHLSSFVLT